MKCHAPISCARGNEQTAGRLVLQRFSRCSRVVLAVLAAVFLPGTMLAQAIGDTEEVVESALGTPTATRVVGNRKTCVYRNDAKLAFENGVVVEIIRAGGESAPLPPPASVTSAPAKPENAASQTRAPAPVRPHAPSTSVTIADKKVLGPALTLVGALTILICSIVILIQAFRASILWGIAFLFLPPIVQWFFVATHWQETRKPLLIQFLVGVPLLFGGYFIEATQ